MRRVFRNGVSTANHPLIGHSPLGIDGGDEAVHKASRPKSSSQVTLCWSKPDSNSRSHPLTRRQTHGSDRMNGAERDTVVGSGSLVTLDPGATKREIARFFPVRPW